MQNGGPKGPPFSFNCKTYPSIRKRYKTRKCNKFIKRGHYRSENFMLTFERCRYIDERNIDLKHIAFLFTVSELRSDINGDSDLHP